MYTDDEFNRRQRRRQRQRENERRIQPPTVISLTSTGRRPNCPTQLTDITKAMKDRRCTRCTPQGGRINISRVKLRSSPSRFRSRSRSYSCLRSSRPRLLRILSSNALCGGAVADTESSNYRRCPSASVRRPAAEKPGCVEIAPARSCARWHRLLRRRGDADEDVRLGERRRSAERTRKSTPALCVVAQRMGCAHLSARAGQRRVV